MFLCLLLVSLFSAAVFGTRGLRLSGLLDLSGRGWLGFRVRGVLALQSVLQVSVEFRGSAFRGFSYSTYSDKKTS